MRKMFSGIIARVSRVSHKANMANLKLHTLEGPANTHPPEKLKTKKEVGLSGVLGSSCRKVP